MSESPALSPADQETVQAEIDRRLEANRIKTATNLAAYVMALGIPVLLAGPVGTVAFLVSSFGLGGWLAGNLATRRVLHAVAKDVGTEGFLDKLKRRVSGAPDRTAHVPALLGMVGSFGILGLMFMAAPVVGCIMGISLAGGAAVWWTHRSAQKTAEEVNDFAQHQPSAAVTVAPASQPIPGAPAMLRSRKADFARAASADPVPDTIYPRKQPSPALKL